MCVLYVSFGIDILPVSAPVSLLEVDVGYMPGGR